MSKDPTKNIDRYKIRGGQMNAFEFAQHQGAVSEQSQEHGNWMNMPETESDLPPDKAKAERIRQLLAEHGETVPNVEESQGRTDDRASTSRAETTEKDAREEWREASENTVAEEEFAPTHGRPAKVIEKMVQSRRATDIVPDPEDIMAGQPPQESTQKKEHGDTARKRNAGQSSTRQALKHPAHPQYQKATKGKEAALDDAKTGKGRASAKKITQAAPQGAKQATAATTTRTSARKSAATQTKNSAKRAASSTKSGTKSAKKTAATGSKKSAKKAAPRAKSAKRATTARTTKATKSASSRATARTAASRQKSSAKSTPTTKARRVTTGRAKPKAGGNH